MTFGYAKKSLNLCIRSINCHFKYKYVCRFCSAKPAESEDQFNPFISPPTKLTHQPVLVREVFERLKPKDGETYLDMTFGAGGHTKWLLASGKKIRVLVLDRDPLALQIALDLSRKVKLRENGQEIIPLRGRFSDLPELLDSVDVPAKSLNGAIMDLGASSMQFDDPSRGFGVSQDGPLDMRMDGNSDESIPTAADVINTLNSDQLAKIFKTYGDEKQAKKIAQAIVDARFMLKSFKTTKELGDLIKHVTSQGNPFSRLDSLGRPAHGATKVFQALRIFVNNELNELNYGLLKILEYLKISSKVPKAKEFSLHDKNDEDDEEEINVDEVDGGKIAVISFHSLEDRIVKRHFFGADLDAPIIQTLNQHQYNILANPSISEVEEAIHRNWLPINKNVIVPKEEEVTINPRSRSAKLRVAARIA